MPKRRYRLNLVSIIKIKVLVEVNNLFFSTFSRNPYFRRPAKFVKPKGVVFDENEVERYKLNLHLIFLFRDVTDCNKTSFAKVDYLVVKIYLRTAEEEERQRREELRRREELKARLEKEKEKKKTKKKRSICKREKVVFWCFLDLAFDQNMYFNYLRLSSLFFQRVTHLLKCTYMLCSYSLSILLLASDKVENFFICYEW